MDTYFREEITAEPLARNLDRFVRVLQAAGLSNGQILNIDNLTRESAVKRTAVERYLQILEDTLLAFRVPAVTLGIRTKETAPPKFVLLDTGVARAAAGLVRDQADSVSKGLAFEALLHHELRGYARLAGKERPIFHHSVSGSFDLCFLVQVRLIEAKLGSKFKPRWTVGPWQSSLGCADSCADPRRGRLPGSRRGFRGEHLPGSC